MRILAGISDKEWFVVSLFVVGCLAPTSVAGAGDKVKASDGGNQVVSVDETLRESVSDEIVGDEKSRSERLDKIIDAQPDSPGPRWQRGLMKTADGWRDAGDVRVEVSDADKKYRELRERVLDDLAGNKQLAKFCQKHKLLDNARGHWQRVLSFNADDADARKALGHIFFDGIWTTRDEAKRVERVRKEYNSSMIAWSKKIPGWINDWRSEDAKRKEKGRENLLAIRDAAAIPLLHAGLAYRSDDDAVLLFEILREIPDIHATRLISEMAVTNQSPQVLRLCTEELRVRDENAFAPQLLLALSSPITSDMRLEIDPNNLRILYRHVFTREGQYSRQVDAVGRDYLGGIPMLQIVTNNPGDVLFGTPQLPIEYKSKAEVERDRAMEKALGGKTEPQPEMMFAMRMAQAMTEAKDRERRKALENMSIEDTNRRVSLVLSKVFDENNGKPEQWWTWWNQRHETQQGGQKPTRAQVQYDQVVDGYQAGSMSFSDAQAIGLVRHGCFVAGTRVATPEGLKPIESMRTGDLVLAQDVESGEITWKPVVQPTKRPKAEVLKLKIGDEPFVCSLKHPFWKTGRGWMWAKELAVGDLVRTSNGSLPITEIEAQPDAPVFNLVVADFSTYFVGENRTLTHDITFRVPTLAIAPGVMPAEEGVAVK